MNRNNSTRWPSILVLRILGSLVVFLCACDGAPTSQPGNLPVTSMPIGSKTYQLEIAADDPSREHGLMERDELPADHGMIFVFPTPAEQSFWMHHTRFPLDIIFLDAQAKVISIHAMKAYDETGVPSDGPSKYAIELAAGEAGATQVKVGDQLQVPQAVSTITAK